MTGKKLSLGIVQRAPTQFDEPLYRHLTKAGRIDLMVYYYGADGITLGTDSEIGRSVGWGVEADRGYPAAFCVGMDPGKFARRVVSAEHDLIMGSGYNHKHTLYTALMARIKDVPVGLRSDNVLPEHGGRRGIWLAKRLIYPILFRTYTTAHPVGRQAEQYFLHFGVSKKSIFRFPYAVDHEWFARESSAARENPAMLRATWGLPSSGQVVCGVMKFSEREDPLTLVAAFKRVCSSLPGTLLLVGDGPLRKQVEKAAGEQLGKTIVLPGYQNYAELPKVYAASDLFVHTANGAWEVSVNEALACGLPVITSDRVGSTRELVLPNRFGCTFRHGDAEDLAAQITKVLKDSELLARARERGLESLEEWGYRSTAERMVAALEFAAQKTNRNSPD